MALAVADHDGILDKFMGDEVMVFFGAPEPLENVSRSALDTALETLAGLRREGKLIGVISHVAALKERIAARIQVEPHTGGRSLLFGPGCARL